jgi:hypothetical protein
MDLNCLIWIVSLVIVKHKRLALSLIEHMRFYELRSVMKPPHFIKRISKVVRVNMPQQLIHETRGYWKNFC